MMRNGDARSDQCVAKSTLMICLLLAHTHPHGFDPYCHFTFFTERKPSEEGFLSSH